MDSAHLDFAKKLIGDAQTTTMEAGLFDAAVALTAALSAISLHEEELAKHDCALTLEEKAASLDRARGHR